MTFSYIRTYKTRFDHIHPAALPCPLPLLLNPSFSQAAPTSTFMWVNQWIWLRVFTWPWVKSYGRWLYHWRKCSFMFQPHEMSVAPPQGGWNFIHPFHIHDRMLIGPVVCRWPQLLWVPKGDRHILSQGQHFPALLPHPLALLIFLCILMFLYLRVDDLEVPFKDEHMIISFFSTLALWCPLQKKLLWTKLQVALNYGYNHKYLEGNLRHSADPLAAYH